MDAADYAISMSKVCPHAKLVVLHVIFSDSEFAAYSSSSDYETIRTIDEIGPHFGRRRVKDNVQEMINRIESKSKENNIEAITQVIASSNIVGGIIAYAENESIDLIVVGTKGTTGFKRLLLGSVASGIITYAHCPVLVVK
jgi:nucleotide-binding universal stress UspA family protein